MTMQWFRMYHEMIEDPKIGTLSDAQFRLWVELLCLACAEGNCGDTGMTEDELNWKLRRNVSETLPVLFQRNLIEFVKYQKGRTTIKIKKWDKRQYQSDNSTDRVRKYREKQKETDGNVSETDMKRFSNALDTDTDTDNITPPTPLGGNRVAKKKPAKRKVPKPPDSINEFISYFEDNGKSKALATEAYKYYDAAGWRDSQGKPVLCWKQKVLANWFPREKTEPKAEWVE